MIRAEPLVTTLFTPSCGLERLIRFGKMPGQAGQDGRLDVRENRTRQESLTAVDRGRLQMLRVFHVER